MRFRVIGLKRVLLDFQFIEPGGHRRQTRIRADRAGGISSAGIDGIFQGIQREIDLALLKGNFRPSCFEIRKLCDQAFGFAVQFDDAPGAFEILKVFLRCVQVAPQAFKLVFHKADGAAGFFGLEGNGLLQVSLHKRVDDVPGQDGIGAGVGHPNDAGRSALLRCLDACLKTGS